MYKVKAVFYYTLSVILGLWFLLSVLGFLGRISNGLPQDAYGWGMFVGKLIVYTLFGFLSIRAFKAGRKNFNTKVS